MICIPGNGTVSDTRLILGEEIEVKPKITKRTRLNLVDRAS
jgi:hypothetical protein